MCITVRPRKPSLFLRSSPSGHSAVHCDRCKCAPLFDDIRISARHRSKCAKEIDEFFFISSYHAGMRLSAPSIALASDEVYFIRKLGKYV